MPVDRDSGLLWAIVLVVAPLLLLGGFFELRERFPGLMKLLGAGVILALVGGAILQATAEGTLVWGSSETTVAMTVLVLPFLLGLINDLIPKGYPRGRIFLIIATGSLLLVGWLSAAAK